MDKNKNQEYEKQHKESTQGISINGYVDMANNPVTHDEFLNLFIKFIESNNWSFGGGTFADNEKDC